MRPVDGPAVIRKGSHSMSLLRLARLVVITGAAALAACSTTYIAPGPKADLQAFMPAASPDAGASAPRRGGGAPSIEASFAAKPAAGFPASIAFVRLQAPSYTNWRLREPDASASGGRYSVVLTREAGEDAQLDRIAQLPQVAGVTGLSRMLLPARLDGDREIRQAAARLQADMVFLYTFDTSFHHTDASRPLSVVTLGLSPTRRISVTTTVSALLMDTRTRYIYATNEATKTTETHATSWGSGDTADEARRQNERDAFAQMADEFAKSWPRLVERYQKNG